MYYDRTCPECEGPFRTNQPHQRFCARACSRRSHGRRWWGIRKAQSAKSAVCRRCEREFRAWSKDQPIYCSRECYQLAQQPESCRVPWKTCRCGAVYVNHNRGHCPPIPKAVKVIALCAYCDTVMEAYPHQRYCSPSCSKRFDKDRRRALRAGAYVEVVHRAKVYERDGWTCQLCGQPVPSDVAVPHPLAPTIDHIIPLGAGGTHEYTNVQLAHFECNSRKRDQVGWTWTETERDKAA